MKRRNRHRIVCILCLLLLPLCGCGKSYTEADLLQLRQQAYLDGYHAGLDEGQKEGSSSEQLEEQYQQGYEAGVQEGYAQGAQETQAALLETVSDSYQQGYETGYLAGYENQTSDADASRQAYLASASSRLPASSSSSSSSPASSSQTETPAPTPADETQPLSQENTSSQVYVTASGKKYHRGDCTYLSKSKQAISLSDAKSKGYSPCSKCKPPQ